MEYSRYWYTIVLWLICVETNQSSVAVSPKKGLGMLLGEIESKKNTDSEARYR